MSRYTTQLRWPVTQFLADLELSPDEANWPRVYDRIGLADYPIFDESHRQVLNDKILRAYWLREIGFETFGQFRWYLRSTMHEIMPYYNQLYKSELMVTDPMLSKDMEYRELWNQADHGTSEQSDTETRTTKSDTSGTSSMESHDRNVFQDTPMNGLDTGAIENMDYATNVTFDDGSTSSQSASGTTGSADTSTERSRTDDGTSSGDRTRTEKGFETNQSELLLTYRKTLVNIDLEIVDRLNVLFFGLW